MNTNISEKPLAGVKVIDLTQAYSGPVCAMHLADLGADVVKVEIPKYGDQTRAWEPILNGNSGYFSYFNRNKTGITLNLKSDEGKEILKKLVAKADVLVENYRVGTMEKLGLGYEVLKEINPALIYASISGFGLEGPMAKRACYDTVAQGMGGMISMTGPIGSDGCKIGPAVADSYSGTYLSVGICAALYQRTRTGLGRRIDVSMVDTVFSILETGVIQYTVKGIISEPCGNEDPVVAPWDSFRAKDGQFIMACGTEKFWQNFCQASGLTELLEDPRYVDIPTRVRYFRTDLKPAIEAWSTQHTVDEIEEIITGVGIPFGRIQNTKEATECELIRSRNMIWEYYDPAFGKEIRYPGCPIKVHGVEDKITKPAPLLGEDNVSVMNEMLGMSEEEVRALQEKGVM